MGLRKSAVEIERVVDLSAADEIADGADARHAAGPETQESKSRMSTATDAELVALGERFEKLLLEYVGSWLNWTPQMRAAHAEVGDNTAALAAALQHAGGEGAQARMSELERDMQPLAEEIIAAPATSLGGLRAKALVALWEAYPAHASHEGAFEFSDDGSRSLFGAVAVMTGLMPLVRELEARLAADVK
jgi:hypothetical protein